MALRELRIQIGRKAAWTCFFLSANEIPIFWDLCIQDGLALMNNVCICIPAREKEEKGCQQKLDFVQVVFVLIALRNMSK